MNYEFKTTFIGNNSCELNNSIIEDGWNDTSESETIDELPRLSVCSNDCNISSRRVSFPKSDSDLVTGYLEPANPWESASEVTSIVELKKLYEESCKKHYTEPLTIVLKHLETLELNKTERHASFNLKDTELTPESCEALEEIFKRVQYEFIDLSGCKLNDMAGSALFDMIEYYEATNELDISDNPGISTRGWQSCISMIRRSKALQNLVARGIVLSELNATNLGKSLNQSCLHTIKLEHCGLTGRPLASLCNSLRKNTTLRELWIAYNDLSDIDAEKLADLLKANAYLEFLDISNNHIKDNGVKQIVIALIEQSTILQIPKDEIELNASNNNNNNNNVLDEIGSSIHCSESNDTFTEMTDNENSFTNDIPLALSSSLTKNSQNVGRSMLDTLLNMNTKENNDNSAVNLEIPLINLNNNNDNDQNENEIKDVNTISDTMNTRVDCLIKQDTCEIKDINCGEDGGGNDSGIGDGGGNIQDDNSSTISGSLTPTPPFNLDSSFSDEKCNENDFLLQNEKRNNENESFKTNNNLIPYNQQQNQQNDLSSSIPPSLSLDTSLHQISSSTILDVNDNNKTLEEFDSNSTDSAFESASEGDTKIFAEDFSKSNYIKMISSSSVHQEKDQYQKNTNNDDDDSNEKNQKEEQQQQLFQQQEQSQSQQLQLQQIEKQQKYDQMQTQSQQQKQQQEQQQLQHFESKSELTDTKESINCNIIVNSESNTIISSEIRNRSLSSDSLSSENSVDLSTDNSQLSKMNEKLTKNDTLTRQKHNDEFLISIKKPRGLQALILWNNDITKDSAEYVADLLDSTNSLELLNIGKNILSNDFLKRIKNSLQRNTTVSNLGLQSTHLNSEGIKILAEILGFVGNKTLQRIDIRDNNVQVEGLTALSEALKSNNTVTRIDIDDVPKRIPEDGNETQFHYSRMLHTVRSLCSRNQKSQEMPPSTANNVKISRNYMSSRKISLTCQSLRTPLPDVLTKNELGLSDTVRKRSGTRLRSPLPSPPTISPSSSPVPSPSRNRFQVLRVNEKSDEASSVEESPPIKKEVPKPRFSRFKVTIIENSSLKPTENKPPIKTNSSIAVKTEEKHKENSAEQSNLNTVNDQKVIESVDKLNSEATNSQQIPLEVDDKKLISILPETSNVEIQTTDENVDDRPKDMIDTTNDKSITDSSKIEEKPQKEETKEELKENIPCIVDRTLSVDQIELDTQATSESELKNEMNIQSPLKETSNIPSETKLEGTKSTENTESRTRRVSWISSGNYPATVDKLLNLFQHPGNLFARSTSPDHDKKIDDNEISSQSLVPLRKQSPPSLFQWHKAQTSDIKRMSSDNMISANLQSYVRGITDFGKQVFKQNVSFMDNTMPVADAQHQQQQQQQQEDCKSIPTDIKKEIKENISPEHTVTKNSIVSFQSVSTAQKMIDISSREAIDKGTENIQTAADTTTTATTTLLESAELCSISRQQQQQQQQQQPPQQQEQTQQQSQQQYQHHHQIEQQLTGICDVRNEKQ